MEAGVMERGGVCASACARVEMFMGRGVYAGGIMAGGLYGDGSFCPECLPQMNVVWSTLMSVIVQDLNEIGQSPDEL